MLMWWYMERLRRKGWLLGAMRRIVWTGLCQREWTCGHHLVQLPDAFRAGRELKRVVRDIEQMPPEHWRAWGINRVSREPVPGFEHPPVKKMLPSL